MWKIVICAGWCAQTEERKREEERKERGRLEPMPKLLTRWAVVLIMTVDYCSMPDPFNPIASSATGGLCVAHIVLRCQHYPYSSPYLGWTSARARYPLLPNIIWLLPITLIVKFWQPIASVTCVPLLFWWKDPYHLCRHGRGLTLPYLTLLPYTHALWPHLAPCHVYHPMHVLYPLTAYLVAARDITPPTFPPHYPLTLGIVLEKKKNIVAGRIIY